MRINKLNKIVYKLMAISLFIASSHVTAIDVKVEHYGHFKKMIHTKNIEGVVDLLTISFSLKNRYAVGAIEHGKGEITIIDGNVWLDYGEVGIGKSINSIPSQEKSVLLASSKVNFWQTFHLSRDLTQHKYMLKFF